MTGYQSIQFAFDDGDYICDYHEATVDEVVDRICDQGSRWFFYPIPFVITGGSRSWRSRAETQRKRIVWACDGYEWMVGLTVATVQHDLAEEFFASNVAA